MSGLQGWPAGAAAYGAMPQGLTPLFYNNPITPVIYGFNPYEMDPS